MGTNRINANSPFRPMRAFKLSYEHKDKLKWPLWGSPKIDGWRCAIKDGFALTNSLEKVANGYVQDQIGWSCLNGFDGEIFVQDGFNRVTSAFNSEGGKPDFVFHVFDLWDMPTTDFETRMTFLQMRYNNLDLIGSRIRLIEHELIYNWEELEAFNDRCLADNFEGSCYRLATAPYKYGRGTLYDGCLYKIKPFEDGEAIIVGFEAQEANLNEATTDSRGLTKRSSHQKNKVGKGTLGKLICQSEEFGEIKIGTGQGLDLPLRQFIWDNQELFRNQFVTFKFQRIGTLNKPRIGVLDAATTFAFSMIRAKEDMPCR